MIHTQNVVCNKALSVVYIYIHTHTRLYTCLHRHRAPLAVHPTPQARPARLCAGLHHEAGAAVAAGAPEPSSRVPRGSRRSYEPRVQQPCVGTLTEVFDSQLSEENMSDDSMKQQHS